MSDVRLRIASLLLLSVAVFFFPAALPAALLWWLFFSKLTVKQKGKAAAAAAVISAVPTIVLLPQGAEAFLYGGKTFVLLILAFWFGQTCKAGEMQSLCVWLFGNRFGFDLGTACEILLMQTAEIQQDAKTYLHALAQKQKKFGVRTILPFSLGILIPALRRSERFAKLLARRGYKGGGTYTPEFSAERADYFRLIFAAGILLLGLLL